jgi:hypothetical protein
MDVIKPPRRYATRMDEAQCELLGSAGNLGSVNVTHDQFCAIEDWFKLDRKAIEKASREHALTACSNREREIEEYNALRSTRRGKPPESLSFEEALETNISFLTRGTDRNMLRRVEVEGARVILFLMHYLNPGEDPVELVARGLSELGFEVSVGDLYEYEFDSSDE